MRAGVGRGKRAESLPTHPDGGVVPVFISGTLGGSEFRSVSHHSKRCCLSLSADLAAPALCLSVVLL